MAKTYYIRQATREDIPHIQELLKITWHKSYDLPLGKERVTELTKQWHTTERLEKDLNKDHCKFLVCEENGEIIATSFLNHQENTAILGRMYIHPNHQNKGIGSQLMEKILASKAKGTCISLTVEPQNTSAIEFYKKFGFKIEGQGSCSEDPHEDIPTLIMKRIETD